MSALNPINPAGSDTRYAAIIASLGRPYDIRALPLPVMHIVMAMRLCALFEAAGREPLVELTTRFSSVTAAEQVYSLVRMVEQAWPEKFYSARPCCMQMSPDEQALAGMARAVLGRDRREFVSQLAGFVRAMHHEPLFAQTVHAVAALQERQRRD